MILRYNFWLRWFLFVLSLTASIRAFSDNLVIGTNANFPPYEFIDGQGNLAGLDIDFARNLADVMGKKLVLKELDLDAQIFALKQGKIDAILSGMYITKQREAEIDMIAYLPKVERPLSLLFWNTVPKNFKNPKIENLPNLLAKKSVTIQSGHAFESELSSLVGHRLKTLPSPLEQVIDLKYQKSICAVVETIVAKNMSSENHLVLFEELSTNLDKDIEPLQVGMGVAKTSPNLKNEIKKAILTLESNGTINQLVEKWCSKSKDLLKDSRKDSMLVFYQKAFPTLLKGFFITLKICFVSMILSVFSGFLIGLLNVLFSKNRFFNLCISVYLTAIRGTPLFIQLLFIYFCLPDLLGFQIEAMTAGVLAIWLNSTAYISEIVRAGLESIPKTQWEAAYVLGYKRIQTLFRVVLPQSFSTIIPGLVNELATVIKESGILMIIGVPEFLKMSRDLAASSLKPFEVYTATAMVYLLLILALTKLAKFLEKRLMCP